MFLKILIFIFLLSSCSGFEEEKKQLTYSSLDKWAFGFRNLNKKKGPASLFGFASDASGCKSRVFRSNDLSKLAALDTKILFDFKEKKVLHLQYSDEQKKGLLLISDCKNSKFWLYEFKDGKLKELKVLENQLKAPRYYYSLDGHLMAEVLILKKGKTEISITDSSKKTVLCKQVFDVEIKDFSLQWDLDNSGLFIAFYPGEPNRKVHFLKYKSCKVHRMQDPRNFMIRASNYSSISMVGNRLELETFYEPPRLKQLKNDDFRRFRMKPIKAPPF